ncbi:Fc.00g067210.m01.CDS01 [Cosmosporella sp. VM-42]
MPTPSRQTGPRLTSLSPSIPSPTTSTNISLCDPPRSDDLRPDQSASVALSAGSSGVSSTAALAVGKSSVASSRSSLGSDDIEMEPIQGHRRRRSSLMSPASSNGTPIRAGPQRPRSPHPGLGDEPKIVEEGAGDDPVSSKDESGLDSFSDEDLHDDEETGLTKKDKHRRQKKRRRNTRLDQRIAREKNLSADERKEADKDVVRKLLINGVLILLWYLFSLSISLYNKWMFDQDRLNFAFPLFTTSMHMLVQFFLASLVLYFIPRLRPHHKSDLGSSRHELEPTSTPGMTKMFYLTRIGPCGAATGLDIGLGNTSLKFISLTFYTMCKSSSLAFVLLFAFAFRLEKPTWRLVAIIATMTLGVVLMVFGEVEFKFGGFALVISAAFFSGFRWGLTQILLLRNPATSNPFSSIFFLTPVMFITLIFLAVPSEGFGNLIEGLKALHDEWGYMAPLFLLFPGCIAFCMTASEFALLQRTSVVTLSIAGIFKEVVTISAASLVFQDQLTLINFIGLLTTMAAIVAYNYIKITKMRQDAQLDVHRHHIEDDPLSPSSNSGSDADDLDDAAEETSGLLRPSYDGREQAVTSDGDFQPLLQPTIAGPSDRPH